MYLSVVLIVLTIVTWALWRKLSYWSRQGVKSDIFFTLHGALEEQHIHTLKMFDKYGRVYGGYTLAFDFLVINDPKLIKEVFVKHFDVFPNHIHINIGPSPKVNRMLFFLPGDDNWKRIRTTITPVFTSSKLKQMLSPISEISDDLVKTLQSIERNDEEVDMRKYLGAFAMDVISACAYGIKINSIDNLKHPIVLNAKKILNIDLNLSQILSVFMPNISSWLKLNVFDINAINELDQIINQVKTKRRKDNNIDPANKKWDFIQLMLDSEVMDEESNDNTSNTSGGKLSSDEVTATGIVFLVAAYDTTTTSLCHLVYYLAQNKDCQQILYEELKDVKEFSYENLSRLKYLNAVIDETLRLAPALLRIPRQSIKDFELSGIKIKAGTCVEVCPYALHRDPKLWPDPLQFKPERFIEPTHDPYAYLPFGAGPRVCIGQRFALNEMRICCAKLFSKFEFSTIPGFKPEYFKGNTILSPKKMVFKIKSR